MNLALKEMTYYKLKYALVAAIIFLLAFLVLFVSSLAQGLGKDNISFIEHMNGKYFVVSEDADNNLLNAPLHPDDVKVLKDNQIPLVQMQPNKVQNNDKFLLTTISNIHALPKDGEIALDLHMSKNYKVNDQLNVVDNKEALKIAQFDKYQMYAHMSVGLVNQDTYKKIVPQNAINTAILTEDMLKDEVKVKDLKAQLKHSKIITPEDAMKAIPSYEAEQMPLNLMVFFLFLISAIVITVFFYIITIQKTTEYGILKAIGTSHKKLIVKLIQEVFIIVMLSVGLAIVVIMAINNFLPPTMPFYLNTNLIFILAGLFLFVAFIGVLLSIIKVLKIDPIEAIGGE
ncbi:ABC transporter permease [Macrococcus capreoli]|uniref:ABC transporter permease n=1 Tax=Macrococcus capreoli TaxID=2982690 RepID=UPI003EE5D93B